ncbi:PH domain-containing protein [Corynebacterium gerontici]|uniref:Low molecular weight protein antigen 6 n=1 Tax=Corynebacterium gerontici TaxID=2079234 RepID=A0A3G6J0H2_9CORY|nr:PH domain-containing protein [Corynebacterium gerontici]AZA11283.1 Low molecular weight protein antigen 6 [Corynebacterium gerontici]
MSEQAQPATQEFKPDRTHLLAAGIMICILLIGISAKPLLLGWVMIFPVLFIIWVFKAKTVVSERGITAHYLFKGKQSATWEEIQGIGFQGSKTVLQRNEGDPFVLPAVSFTSLPKLEAASRGRISDVLSAGRKAADEKVTVVHKDGRQVLMTKEEYAHYEATKQGAAGQRREAKDEA